MAVRPCARRAGEREHARARRDCAGVRDVDAVVGERAARALGKQLRPRPSKRFQEAFHVVAQVGGAGKGERSVDTASNPVQLKGSEA